MVQLIQRSPSSVSSINVMQLELSTFCAGSCPVARKTAVTILAAWALNPPIDPANADPIKFLSILSLTIVFTSVLRVARTTSFGIVASTTTDFPLPSIQLIAEGFLSVQTLPLKATSSNVGNIVRSKSTTASVPFDTIFIPIASPLKQTRRTYAFRPAIIVEADCNFPKPVVDSNAYPQPP